MSILEIILLIVSIGLSYLVWNLFRKNELLEQEKMNNDQFLTNIQDIVIDSYDKIIQVDSNYTLENDEVVGFVYSFHKEVIRILDEYFK